MGVTGSIQSPDSAVLAGDREQWEVVENSIAEADPLDTIDANEYQIIQTVKKLIL